MSHLYSLALPVPRFRIALRHLVRSHGNMLCPAPSTTAISDLPLLTPVRYQHLNSIGPIPTHQQCRYDDLRQANTMPTEHKCTQPRPNQDRNDDVTVEVHSHQHDLPPPCQLCPLSLQSWSSLTKYATANWSICNVALTICCTRLGLNCLVGAHGGEAACEAAVSATLGFLLSPSESLGVR